MSVQALGWELQTRTLTFKPAGASDQTIRGRLSRPSPEELQGGLSVYHWILLVRSEEMERVGLDAHPFTNNDQVADGSRTYSVDQWQWIYGGEVREWYRAAVVG